MRDEGPVNAICATEVGNCGKQMYHLITPFPPQAKRCKISDQAGSAKLLTELWDVLDGVSLYHEEGDVQCLKLGLH